MACLVGGFGDQSDAPVPDTDLHPGRAIAVIAKDGGVLCLVRVGRQGQEGRSPVDRPGIAAAESSQLAIVARPAAIQCREVRLEKRTPVAIRELATEIGRAS